ncbi:MAG: ABC transporter permease subunit [Thermomicrobiales bacterium]|nr:ABC transporter permease subunit [Thermomicrobiales bacterium]
MGRFLIQRLLSTIPVVLGVSIAVFAMLHLVPGDPIQMMLGEFQTTPEQVEKLKAQLYLDKPLPEQYLRFVTNAAQGDLGYSIRSKRPVMDEIRDNLPSTIVLTLAGLAIAVVIGMTLGIVAAVKQNTWADLAAMIMAMLGVSMPSFWLGLLLIFGFSLKFNWFPATGGGDFKHLVLPAVTLGLGASAIIARLTRSTMLEVLRQEYIITARAKGLRNSVVIIRHALRNAMIPTITILGLQFGQLLAGTVVIETVFGRPGIGRLIVAAILEKDFPLVQGIVLFIALAYVLINLLVDVLYAVLDPRISIGVTIHGRGEYSTSDRNAGMQVTRAKRPNLFARLRRSKVAVAGFVALLILVIMAVAAPIISPYEPNAVAPKDALLAPSGTHLFGTDQYGRDVFSRVVYGTRLSLMVGFISVTIAVVIGTLMGLIAGYYGRWTDTIIMRFVDIMLAFPGILLALALVSILGPSLPNLMIAVGISSVPAYARIVRSSVLSARENVYVDAARVVGATDGVIMRRHVLPNVVAPVIVLATLGTASAILWAASLSFLGLGSQPPTPEWGRMLSEGRNYLREQWWIATFPGIAIMVTVLAMNLLGDGLRDTLDPRQQIRA